jgi:FkbM family methyltransferase
MDLRMVRFEARRIVRTAQTFFPVLADAKPAVQSRVNQFLQRPFEADFAALRLLGREAGQLYVDVGANRGQSIDAIRMTANRPRIVSFEANQLFAEKLRRRYAQQPEIRIEATGLGAEEGIFTLHIPSYRGYVFDGLASLDREAAMSWIGPLAVLRFDPAKLQCHTVTCSVRPLDSFTLKPFFIKIDVEKLEMEVLRGARQTLEQHHPILLVESDNPEVSTFLRSFHYQAFAYDSQNRRFLPSDGIGNSFFVPKTKLNLIGTACGVPGRYS